MSNFTLINKTKEILDFEHNIEQHLVVDFNLMYKEKQKFSSFQINKKRK